MLLARVEATSHNLWHVFTPYSEPVVAQFRAMPGCTFDRAELAWCGAPEAVGPVLQKLEDAKIATVTWPPDRPSAPINVEPVAAGLYDFQRTGVEFIVRAVHDTGAALLADSMGCGKSVQALRATKLLGESRVLIVCPPVAVQNWVHEIRKHLDEPAEVVGRKLKKKEGGGRLLTWEGFGVVGYDTFRGLKDVAPAGLVILDELHYCSNPKAKRTKAVAAYTAATGARLIGLTGTPITARPRDIWSPLDILWPGRFGNWWKFTGRYCEGHYEEITGLDKPVWVCDGASNLDELGERLRSGLMLRRTKGEVLELPMQQRIIMPVELPERARVNLVKATVEVTGERELGRALSAIEEHKIKAAIELVSDLRASGRRVLVFTLRRDTAAQIGKALDVPYVTGEHAPAERAKILGAVNCGVATIYSVTTAINLVNFDTCVFVGLDWVPSTLLQAEARTHRIGQDRDVIYYYLMGMGTLDETICAKVIERLDNFSAVVGSAKEESELSGALRGNKSDDDLIADLIADMEARFT